MHFALKSSYPIETAEQVKTAAAYFEKHISRFDFVDRSVAASSIEKRASELKIIIKNDWVKNYGRSMRKEASYSPTFEDAIKSRIEMCKVYNIKLASGDREIEALPILEKLAKLKPSLPARDMVDALAHFDKEANLDAHYDTRIYDPIFSVYGNPHDAGFDRIKLAEDLFDDDLNNASQNPSVLQSIENSFGSDVKDQFITDPVGTYGSMQMQQKTLVDDIVRENG